MTSGPQHRVWAESASLHLEPPCKLRATAIEREIHASKTGMLEFSARGQPCSPVSRHKTSSTGISLAFRTFQTVHYMHIHPLNRKSQLQGLQPPPATLAPTPTPDRLVRVGVEAVVI